MLVFPGVGHMLLTVGEKILGVALNNKDLHSEKDSLFYSLIPLSTSGRKSQLHAKSVSFNILLTCPFPTDQWPKVQLFTGQ